MRGFWNRFQPDWDNLRNTVGNPRRGSNPMGEAQFRFEEGVDSVYDRTGSALWSGAKGVGKGLSALWKAKVPILVGAGLLGAVTHPALGLSVAGASLGVFALGQTLKHIPGAAFNSAGGLGGIAGKIATGATGLGMTVLGVASKLAVGTEALARIGLTGGIRGVGRGIDAWMPNFRNLPSSDIRRFAANPRIIRRLTGIGLAVGIGSAAKDLISPGAPPPTAIFDGLYMHHMNDMGANAYYAQAVLGSNSVLNQDYTNSGRLALIEALETGSRSLSSRIMG